MDIVINYGAVVAAAIAAVILGSLWYGPLFGKQWMAITGMSKGKIDAVAKKAMIKSYVLVIVGALVKAVVLAYAIPALAPYLAAWGTSGIAAGIVVGLMLWIGFIAPTTLDSVLWEMRPWKLWLINNGYHVVTLAVMAAILAAWA